MGENEATESKVTAAPVVATEKAAVKAASTENKKKDKPLVAKPETVPHLTGRLLQVEIGSGGVEFAIKGKKSKAEVFSLKGMDASAMPAAATLLAGLLESKAKLRVEFTAMGDTRTVNKLRAQH
jgi:hypothetical protein